MLLRILFTSISLLLLSASLPAQSLDRFVIGSTGGYSETANLTLEFTAGESATATLETGTLVLNQGFHQTNPPYSTSVDLPSLEVSYQLYPNPTTDKVFVELQSDQPIQVEMKLMDLRGRITSVPAQAFPSQTQVETQFDLSALPAGRYLLQVIDLEGQIAKSFRIEKR